MTQSQRRSRSTVACLLALVLGGCWQDVAPAVDDAATLATVDAAGGSGDDVLGAATGPACELPNDAPCARGATCPSGVACNGEPWGTCTCTVDGTLTCTDLTCPPAGDDAGARTCSTRSDCAATEVCAFPTAGCGAIGVCEPALLCGTVPRAYCGCDGMTHTVPTCNPPPMPYTSFDACPNG